MRQPRPARQDGMVLIIALIVLVIMTMGTLSVVRSIDAANTVAGNLSFKQSATAAGDAGVEAGIAWLQPQAGAPALYQDVPNSGYYATAMDLLDITGEQNDPDLALVDWDFNGCHGAPSANCVAPSQPFDAGNGNTVSYLINRLCTQPLDPNQSQNSCATNIRTDDGSAKRGELKYGDDKRFGSLPVEYYRVIARAKGPKNTISFVETILHF